MSKFLLIDIGAGTMDILFYDEAAARHYKAVVKSPVRHLADKVEKIPGNLLITGNEMGGGPITRALKKRAQDAEVVMTASAAATIHHSEEKVRSMGISIIADSEAEVVRHQKDFSLITIADLEIERLQEIIEGFGVPFKFDVVGICAQDHGIPPTGVTHLDYRHNLFEARLDKNPFPHALLYKKDEVPDTMNRLKSIADSARVLPADDVYVMDSGMAAILGASMDIQAFGKNNILILDVATSHTLGAAMTGKELSGFFEYHTSDITLDRLESLLTDLADGKLIHKRILEEGGHGAYIRHAFGMDSAEIIIATGPNRRLVEKTGLPISFGAPLGDNMMTGTVGLLEAIRRRKDLKPITYI